MLVDNTQRGVLFVIWSYNLRHQRCIARRFALVVSRAIEAPIKKAIAAPRYGTDLFTEHPAIAIYFIDSHLL